VRKRSRYKINVSRVPKRIRGIINLFLAIGDLTIVAWIVSMFKDILSKPFDKIVWAIGFLLYRYY